MERTVRFVIRLSDAENVALEKLAKQLGGSRSMATRYSILRTLEREEIEIEE